MNTRERSLEQLGALWRREREAARARARAERVELTFEARVERGTALDHLEVVDVEASAGRRVRLWLAAGDADLELARVGQGDPVLLHRGDPDDAVRGVVARRLKNKLAVVVDDDYPEWLDEGHLRLDLDANESTFDRGDRAIQRAAELAASDPRHALVEVLLGDAVPDSAGSDSSSSEVRDPDLNEAQRLAVDRALVARPLSLILGPPGTGKTRTLAEVVRRAVARGDRVLVTAASNLAVDNLAERLLAQGERLVRLGHPARVTDAVEAHTLDAQLEGTPESKMARDWIRDANALRHKARARFARGSLGHRERRELMREASQLARDAYAQLATVEEAILLRHRVVCATAAGADSARLRAASFDLVVLDEATQAVDPVALAALLRAPRAVLAGDPHQLPPTVLDLGAERDGLGTTFFERLARRVPTAVTMLEVQHRMHDTLMRFPSEQTYGGRLRAHPSVASHQLAELGVEDDPRFDGPFVYLDTAGMGFTEERRADDPSTENPAQAERVTREVRRLLARGLPASEVAVITPYLAQARRLREALVDELARGLEVGTVDGFQGREKEAVIVDLVRSNDEGALGFLTDVRRLNVAITRARRFLMVVADSATVAQHPFHAAYLAYADEVNAYLSGWIDPP